MVPLICINLNFVLLLDTLLLGWRSEIVILIENECLLFARLLQNTTYERPVREREFFLTLFLGCVLFVIYLSPQELIQSVSLCLQVKGLSVKGAHSKVSSISKDISKCHTHPHTHTHILSVERRTGKSLTISRSPM